MSHCQQKTIRLWSFNHPYWALRPWFSNAFKCVLNFNYVQRPLLFRKVFRRVLICFAELKLESNKKASGTYRRAIKGESEQWNQSCDHRVITQSSLLTLYFNNQGRERSACPSLQTLEVPFFCRLKPYDLTRVLSFLVNQGCWIWELIFFHCTFHQTNNSQHAMVTVEQTPAVRPIERLPLIPRKAGSSPGWVIARPAPVSALLVLPL